MASKIPEPNPTTIASPPISETRGWLDLWMSLPEIPARFNRVIRIGTQKKPTSKDTKNGAIIMAFPFQAISFWLSPSAFSDQRSVPRHDPTDMGKLKSPPIQRCYA
ncbi:hypothetical protein KAX17_09570, partial [Candidatus Bipolaricaulota bacterium]|nr:hypothetical protein [Candidatus Bipolaricaulota bacterium]